MQLFLNLSIYIQNTAKSMLYITFLARVNAKTLVELTKVFVLIEYTFLVILF